MPWVAGVGYAVGGLLQSSGAQQAASTSAQAQQQAGANTMAMFQQTQQNLQPYMQAGNRALNDLIAGTIGNYTPPTLPGGLQGYDQAYQNYLKLLGKRA